MFKKLWNSPTLTTWLSYSTKSATLLFVVPLVLKRFDNAELAIWLLFASITAMSGVADLGFRQTFIRAFALAYGGAKDLGVFKRGEKSPYSDGVPNWELMERLWSMTRRIYLYLTIFLGVALFILGTIALRKSVAQTKEPNAMWISWGITVIGIVADFYGKSYANYLEGLYQVAMVKRIETLTRIGAILSGIGVLLFAPTIINLSIASTFWLIVNTVRDYYLAHRVFDGKAKTFKKQPFEKTMFKKIWSPAWRSGISGLMSNGLTNLTGIIYAQVGNAGAVASYMIALRLVTEIRNVSNAPFYSKIALMARLRAEGNYKRLIEVAQRGMLMAHIVYTVGALVVGLFADTLIRLAGSHIHFVEPRLWLLLTIAFYVHRYGAMHMQLYLTTNHVIAHIADGISGAIFIGSSMLLVKVVGVYAVPLGMLAGYLGFYAWYSSYYSLRSLKTNFFAFEKKVSLIPAISFLVYSCFRLFF